MAPMRIVLVRMMRSMAVSLADWACAAPAKASVATARADARNLRFVLMSTP
ncbi:hypothetical protein D3C72_1813340 [compost metagenome]